MLEHIMLHLDSIYDGLFITYSKLNQFGNFNLYALSYKISGVKDDEAHTAALDTTYTAENDRYDVFEGSVNMTPEELEGKSVFLWTESKEEMANAGSFRGYGSSRMRMGCILSCMTAPWNRRVAFAL